MKTIKTLLVLLFICTLTSFAEERELTVSDIQKSGCVSHVRGADAYNVQTMVLTKNGSELLVELFLYYGNCATQGFEVTPVLDAACEGASYSDSVTIGIKPIIPAQSDCGCPFNVSFKVHGLESNRFYLFCWWFDGLVELTEGEPLVLENVLERVEIEGARYYLKKNFNQAMMSKGNNNWEGAFRLPSEVTYQGQTYSVTALGCSLFSRASLLEKIIIPATIKDMNFNKDNYTTKDYPINPFSTTPAVKEIEVEAGNVVVKSIDGVLFDKKGTILYAYPEGNKQTSYKVPDGVVTIANKAFYGSSLKVLDLPESVRQIAFRAIPITTLTDLYIRGVLDPEYYMEDQYIFYDMGTSTTLHVLPSEVEKFKAIYKGPVVPLSESDYPEGIRTVDAVDSNTDASRYNDLQGRKVQGQPARGIYIKNGKKVVIK